MDGGEEVNATGVGETGVGLTGVEIEVVVEGGAPDGWNMVTNRRRRSGASKPLSQAAPKGAANAKGKRTAVDLSRSPSQGAKRPRQVSPNCYEALFPSGLGVGEEDVGPEVQVVSPTVARRSQRLALTQRASPVGADAIDEAVATLDREHKARQLRLKKSGRHRNARGESTSANEDSDEGDARVECTQEREADVRQRTVSLLTEMRNMPGRAIEGDEGVEEVDVSAEDEARFTDALRNRERWGASQSSSGSSNPGSMERSVTRELTVQEHRSAPHRRSTRPARAPANHPRLCCANHQCGKIFEGKQAKGELRYHFEVESVVCRPCEANYDHYKSCGLWRCESCDIWFDKQHKNHDCTKRGARRARQTNLNSLHKSMKRLRDQRAGPRRHPEAVGADPFDGIQDRLDQAAGDVANNYRGGIAARAEAELQDLGELGERMVSDWHCLTWLRCLSWSDVNELVGCQTLRPSGKYSGPFHTAYRKCMAMVIKVYGSDEADAKLLGQKLLFLLVRLIYAPVEGTIDINKVLLQRSSRFLKGEWEGLLDDYVETNGRRRGVLGQPTLSSQRARATRLMEAGLVSQSVSLLGESKICDIRKAGVM